MLLKVKKNIKFKKRKDLASLTSAESHINDEKDDRAVKIHVFIIPVIRLEGN